MAGDQRPVLLDGQRHDEAERLDRARDLLELGLRVFTRVARIVFDLADRDVLDRQVEVAVVVARQRGDGVIIDAISFGMGIGRTAHGFTRSLADTAMQRTNSVAHTSATRGWPTFRKCSETVLLV